MKKGFVVGLIAIASVFSLSACGGSESKEAENTTVEEVTEVEQTAAEEKTEVEQTTEVAERDLPQGDYEDMGTGIMYIATAGGTSENGNIPVVYVPEDILLEQIEVDSEGMDGTLLSYIYIDGYLNETEQLADTQTTITLEGDDLTEGVHLVEVVQYTDNDASGEMITYKSGSYEIIIK